MIMMHAENGMAIDVLVAQALAEGKTDPRYHSLTRPWETEAEATNRAIMLARLTGAPLYVVHMSAKQAVAVLQAREGRGPRTSSARPARSTSTSPSRSSCPQPGFEGAKWVCSTPLRSEAEGHQDELWRYLRTNDLSIVSTDHCPFCFKEQKELGLGDFSKIPNGIGSVEHRMDLIYQGVVDGKITLERWVELCSTTPARMFGLYPQKGVIAPGSDADIVVYDPTRAHRDRPAQDPPHEHGPLGLGGLRHRRPRRRRALARQGRRRPRRVPRRRRATGSTSSGACPST